MAGCERAFVPANNNLPCDVSSFVPFVSKPNGEFVILDMDQKINIYINDDDINNNKKSLLTHSKQIAIYKLKLKKKRTIKTYLQFISIKKLFSSTFNNNNSNNNNNNNNKLY